MNHHAPLRQEVSPVRPVHISEIERLAGALHRAALVLRSTPRHPDFEEVVKGREDFYAECVADMRKALENV